MFTRNSRYSAYSMASSSTTRAISETQSNHLLMPSILTNAEVLPPIVCNRVTRSVSARSSFEARSISDRQRDISPISIATTHLNHSSSSSPSTSEGEGQDAEMNQHPLFGSLLNRQEVATPAIAEDIATRGVPAPSALATPEAVPRTQRKRSRRKRCLRYSYAKSTKKAAAPPAITPDPVTSSVSTHSSLTTEAVSNTQRKRNRRKRSLRYSYSRNTKRSVPPVIVEDQVARSEETPVDEKCAICLDTTDHQQLKLLPCGHIFHDVCVDTWLSVNKKCPLCRKVTKQYSTSDDDSSSDESSLSDDEFFTAMLYQQYIWQMYPSLFQFL